MSRAPLGKEVVRAVTVEAARAAKPVAMGARAAPRVAQVARVAVATQGPPAAMAAVAEPVGRTAAAARWVATAVAVAAVSMVAVRRAAGAREHARRARLMATEGRSFEGSTCYFRSNTFPCFRLCVCCLSGSLSVLQCCFPKRFVVCTLRGGGRGGHPPH